MAIKKVVISLPVLALLIGIVLWMVSSHQVMDASTLAGRCAASRPTWDGYQEDIKAINAAAVAAWHGAPIHVHQEGLQVTVRFAITGDWRDYRCAIPILLRDPLNRMYHPDHVVCEKDLHVYSFTVSQDAGEHVFPWIKLRYPHREDRILLNEDGIWTDSSP
jgi:hypothetical protein